MTGGFFDVRGVKLPVAVSAFAEEIYQAPKSWAEKTYVKLIHYNKFPKGTHFAAWGTTRAIRRWNACGVQVAAVVLSECRGHEYVTHSFLRGLRGAH